MRLKFSLSTKSEPNGAHIECIGSMDLSFYRKANWAHTTQNIYFFPAYTGRKKIVEHLAWEWLYLDRKNQIIIYSLHPVFFHLQLEFFFRTCIRGVRAFCRLFYSLTVLIELPATAVITQTTEHIPNTPSAAATQIHQRSCALHSHRAFDSYW